MRRGPFVAAAAGALVASSALRPAATAMSDETLTRLDVLHLSDVLATRARLTPELFEAHADLHRTTVRAGALIVESLRRVKSAGARAGDAAPDVRWGLLYHDASGVRGRTLFLDKFGKRGIENGRVIALAGESLVEWLRAKFGA